MAALEIPCIGGRRVRMNQVRSDVVTHWVKGVSHLGASSSVRQLKNAWHDNGIVTENFLTISPQEFVHLVPQKYAEIFQGMRAFEERTGTAEKLVTLDQQAISAIAGLNDPGIKYLAGKLVISGNSEVGVNRLLGNSNILKADGAAIREVFQQAQILFNLTRAVLARCVHPQDLPKILVPFYGDRQGLALRVLTVLKDENIPEFNRLKQRLIEAGYQLCLDGLDFSQREGRLEELDLSFITLRKSIFSGRTLVRGKLEKSDASEAVFEQTVFNHVNLHGLNAAGAKFSGAQFLNGCSLFLMKVSEKTDFRNVNFVNTVLGPEVRSKIFINCRGSVWLPETTENGPSGFKKTGKTAENFPWAHLPHQTFVKWVAE